LKAFFVKTIPENFQRIIECSVQETKNKHLAELKMAQKLLNKDEAAK
jgi:hypothetical protein